MKDKLLRKALAKAGVIASADYPDILYVTDSKILEIKLEGEGLIKMSMEDIEEAS